MRYDNFKIMVFPYICTVEENLVLHNTKYCENMINFKNAVSS